MLPPPRPLPPYQLQDDSPAFPTALVAPFDESVKAELSVTKNDPHHQFPTCDDRLRDGYPQNRTLVYRGWLFDNKDSSVLTFATDKRMSKYKGILHNDKCEAVFISVG